MASDAAPVVGAYYRRLYAKLWDEDESMMVRRQAVLDGTLDPRCRDVAVDGQSRRFVAVCPHLGGPLDAGERDGDVVTCPWHGSQFDVCTGDVVAGPAVFPQPVYESRVREGRVELRPL